MPVFASISVCYNLRGIEKITSKAYTVSQFSLSYFVTEKYSNFNITTVPVRNKGFKVGQTKDQKKTT